jgi:hypothetical protein
MSSLPITIAGLNAAKAQAYLIAYDAKFQKAMAVDGPANDYLADYIYSPPINPSVHLVRLPIPLSAPELKLFKGRRHYRKNSTAFIDLVSVPYDDGVEEDADKIAAMDWAGFSASPESIAAVIKGWRSKNLAILLNTGETFTDWTGGNFLSATKYANPFKRSTSTTFKTFWASTPLTVANVQAMIADMVSRRGFNAMSLGFGVRNVTLFASSTLWPTANSIAKDLTLPGAASNPIVKYGLTPEAWPDLASTRWGILQGDPGTVDTHPVFGALQDSPQVLVSGKDSAKFEITNQMGHNVKVRLGAALMRYEAISVADTG